MGPVRKSRSLNKRFFPENDVGNSSKSKPKQRKRKLSDKLGPQWTKGELERFYDAYRNHGQDWRKVAAMVRNNRSLEMVEALFHMNRAYLSLPEGTASIAGLIAMMTDHYSVMEGSESEGEGRESSRVRRKYQKRKHFKARLSESREGVNSSHFAASREGCLSFLKQAQAHGSQIRATGRRTPRVPVPSPYTREDRDGSSPPSKRARKLDNNESLPIMSLGKMSLAREAQSKVSDSSLCEGWLEGDREKRRKNGVSEQDAVSLMDMEGAAMDYDNSGESCSATEGLRGTQIGNANGETTRGKYSQDDPTKRNKKHPCGDEFDALQALAELSASMLPELMESDSSAQLKEERAANDTDEKSSTPESMFSSHSGEKPKEAIPDDDNALCAGLFVEKKKNRKRKQQQPLANGTLTRKRKPKELAQDESLVNKTACDESQLKAVDTSEEDRTCRGDVTVSVLSALSDKPIDKRKMNLKKMSRDSVRSSETTSRSSPSDENLPEHESSKEKLSICLSYPLARRRCIYEWFYSAIDYPWFAMTDFVAYLNHVGLGHVPRLTRTEWSVIKSSLGRPRRLSERFFRMEREKLKNYRESVRKHYAEVRSGAREGLPADLARPLSVGSKVIAIHPKTREINEGKILSVDHNKYGVLFDCDDLGAEFVMDDIDCMALNPLECLPECMRKQINKRSSIEKEGQMNKHPDISSNRRETESYLTTPPLEQVGPNPDTNNSQSHKTNYSKEREAEIQRSLAVQGALDQKEMREIVKGSWSSARVMVSAAIKAASSAKRGEEVSKKIQEALESTSNQQPLHSSIGPSVEHANGSLDHHLSQLPSYASEPLVDDEGQMPSELISACVSTWLMIQKCTERQYPPAVMATLIDAAVMNLFPRCAQNLPIYSEIKTCLNRIKTQILALVPA